MDGEKEKEREKGDEKESDETEEDKEGAALIWQERYPEDDLGLPIMHWEDLSLRIAELEKQQEQRRQKEKDLDSLTVGWPEIRGLRSHRETYEDTEDDCNSRLTALTSRVQSQMNLQLCFINNSESEEEEEEIEAKKEVAQKSSKSGSRQRTEKQQGSNSTSTKKAKSGGFKNDVRAALSLLRHKLRLEQKQTIPPSEAVREREHYERSDLKNLSLKELKALRTSLSKDIHDFSSELVGRLLTRDQLRTEQDALLLEVQDMTSL
ncbi:schwannomin-interacting protein 1-like isoform X2 [Myxocyprinus asiaticus]|uniref:schwannomin-interacting protein 1-like isoform X2 n=1 Tax=Myxocyprinus asiaticus TaxID=70543 RepID=UPI0022239FB9|nr:schwannomin-interacting protein 1-like isoform X2 [Myxocyprinus asiaticus]XP_051564539.1 schwannomin-interacting protein 1-like isoform X2 [Myxocyprinus asiaticus]